LFHTFTISWWRESARAVVGDGAHEFAHVDDALWVEAVGRLIQHEQLRFAEQRGGDAETLPRLCSSAS